MKRFPDGLVQIFKQVKKEDLAAAGTIVGIYGMMGMMGITCPILFMTGISCAGCGMTRAWMSLLRLDFKSAFYYHPLFWLPALMMILFLFNKKIFRKWYWIWAVLFLVVYGFRMFTGQDGIVVFQPTEGFLYRLAIFLKELITKRGMM